MKKTNRNISWVLQIIVVVLIAKTLPLKFGADPKAVMLFTELGMEPNGRILTAVVELIACVLLLIPASSVYGALLASGLMSGALIGHITKLGFTGPLGQMGILAIVIFTCTLVILFLRRSQLPIISRMFAK